MSGVALIDPKVQFFSAAGAPLVNGTVTVYLAGTTTPTNTWQDQALTSLNTNPIVLDSPRGEAVIWVNPDVVYKFVLKNAGGVTQWTVDNIKGGAPSAITSQLLAATGAGMVGFSHANTYTAGTVGAKLKSYLNVKDAPFNAVGDGVADDSTAVAAALAAAGGRNLYFPGGTYLTHTMVLPSNITLVGDGSKVSVLKFLAGSTGYMLHGTDVSNVTLLGVGFDGNKTNCPSADQTVRIDGASTNFEMRDCDASNGISAGVAIAGSTGNVTLVNNTCNSNAVFGIVIASTGTTHLVTGNRCNDNGQWGILAATSFARITNNSCSGNGNAVTSGAGIGLVNSQYCLVESNQTVGNGTVSLLSHGIQFNTCATCMMVGNMSNSNSISGLDVYASTFCQVVGNTSFLNTIRGIEVDSVSSNCTVTGNTVYQNKEVGISVYGSINTILTGNIVSDNGTAGVNPYGIWLHGFIGNFTQYPIITGNIVQDNHYAATGTGIVIDVGCTNVTLTANQFLGNTIQTSIDQSSLIRARDNLGFITQAAGSAVIASGATNVTISHGLSVTPTPDSFTIVATNAGTNTIDVIYVTNITSTQFKVNCRTDPGAGGLNFRWKADVF